MLKKFRIYTFFESTIFRKVQSNTPALVAAFNRWQLESISFKHQSFSYENEYRIAAFSKTSLFQKGKYGQKEYHEVKVPLSSLVGILTGPFCKTDTIRSIKTLCKQIEAVTGRKIETTQSRLPVR